MTVTMTMTVTGSVTVIRLDLHVPAVKLLLLYILPFV